MTDLILDNISLIIFLPLWIFLIIMCGRFFSVYVNKKIIYILTLLASILGAGICGFALINLKNPVEYVHPFLRINDFSLTFGLQADKLSLIMGLILFIVSFAVQLFSISYMEAHQKTYRFFALLNLFNFSMAMLLFSPNLFQLYVFWELVGIVSYLLIGFDYTKIEKSDASKRVFIINRIGDTALITAIILTSYYMYSYVGHTSFTGLSFEDFNAISTLLMAYAPPLMFYAICGLFIVAACVKSAQFPFHQWLQEAMEAKLPVSALLHSATMVAAGVYLIIRLMPFFTLNHRFLTLILLAGLVTALICSILASVETKPKKVLAYSTSANLGLMFVCIGAGNIKAALVFLCAHAFIKSSLFLSLPKDEKNISNITFIIFCIGALSLSGVMFAGLSVKEILFNSLKYNQILSYIFISISFISAFYIIRLAFMLYDKTQKTQKFDYREFFAFLILLGGNIIIYYLIRGTYTISEPFAAAIGGGCLALLLYKRKKLEIISNPKILEKLFNKFVPYVYSKFAEAMNFIENNIFSNYNAVIKFSKSLVFCAEQIENKVMNRTISAISDISKEISKRDSILQSGNVQTYNAYALIIVTVIIALVITGYIVILS